MSRCLRLDLPIISCHLFIDSLVILFEEISMCFNVQFLAMPSAIASAP